MFVGSDSKKKRTLVLADLCRSRTKLPQGALKDISQQSAGRAAEGGGIKLEKLSCHSN